MRAERRGFRRPRRAPGHHQGRASRVSHVDVVVDNQSLSLEEAHKVGLGVK